MMAAIPLYGREVAPRFCFASEVLLVELLDGEVRQRRRVSMSGLAWVDRLRLLEGEDVEALFCGGFNRRLLPVAVGMGIKVIWGLAGDAETVVTKLQRGELTERCPNAASAPVVGRGRRGGGRGGGRRGARARRRGRPPFEQIEESTPMSDDTGILTVAVAAEDDRGLDGQVSAHFGRCPFYVVAVVDGREVTDARVVQNPNASRHQPGAMPRFIQGLGADAILAGGMGPRAIDMFDAMGIEVATGASGRVSDVVTAFLEGRFQGVVPCEHDAHGGHDGCGSHGDATERAAEGAVAFAVRGAARGIDAELDPRFGRAERFLVVDVETEVVLEEIDNPVIEQAHGAGSAAASIVAGRGAKAIVSGRFGPNALTALEGLGLQVYVAPEAITTVRQALPALRSGALGLAGGSGGRTVP